MGLSPKPSARRKFNWEDLDNYLQTTFGMGNEDETSISPSNYLMSKDEIIAELHKNGYQVTDHGDFLTVR